jgi:hypothetical protein
MSDNDQYYEVVEYINGETSVTILLKEQAERLYRKIRAKGGNADIKPSVCKVVGVQLQDKCARSDLSK